MKESPIRWHRGLIPLIAFVALTLSIFTALPSSAEPSTAPSWQIELLNGSFTPTPGVDSATVAAVGTRLQQQASTHVLLQLNQIPTQQGRANLARYGIQLGTYVPNKAWTATITDLNLALQAPGLRWIGDWTAADKLHPNIQADVWNEWAIHPTQGLVMVFVQLHHDVSLAVGNSLAAAHGGIDMPPVIGLHGMTVWLPKGNLSALAGEEEVMWIEEGPAPLSPTNDGARDSMQVDPLYSTPYNLDGTGVRLFVFDAGTARATHLTFDAGGGSRVTNIDGQSSANHPTHVAGTAAGDGSNSPGNRGQGVAPGVDILSAGYEQTGGTMLFWDNAGDIEVDYADARVNYDADLGTNSIGSNTANNGYLCEREGNYGVTSNLVDGIVRGDHVTITTPLIMTWANGNERTGGSPKGRCGSNYRTTAPPSCAKNPIHIGATNSDYDSMTSFSSWGPCDDGRLKPIVSAPGCELGHISGETYIYSSLNTHDRAYGGFCGTSMATPAVAGVVSLMIEDWRAQGYGTALERPLPALVKAMLMHTARDLGQDGPDYIYGYGEVDAQAAIDLIRRGNNLGGLGPVNWGEDIVSQGITDTFTVTVPANAAMLKVSLAWDDYPAAAFITPTLVNDLDLQVIGPDATAYSPWVLGGLAAPHQDAITGTNSIDNQEQVVVNDPQAGVWTIRVKGTTVPEGPQTYGLVYSSIDHTFNPDSCVEALNNTGFEVDTSSWTLSGAQRVAAPAAGHGSFSLQLGGSTSSTDTAYQQIAIPADAARAELSFSWYMTTTESLLTGGFDWDDFFAQIRDTSDSVLATFDYRNDGWPQSEWMRSENIDLSPWAGQTVRVYFVGANDSIYYTTFWVDDISLQTCDPVYYADDDYTALTSGWGVSHFDSIQAGVNAAGTGHTIFVENVISGTEQYVESVSLNKTVTVTVSGDMQISGTLTISDGVFVAPAGTMALTQDLVRSGGSFDANGGIVTFNSGAGQELNATVPTTFNHLELGSGTMLTETQAADNITVTGTITNLGTLRKIKPIGGTGTYTFGLVGATVTVTNDGGSTLTSIRIDSVDSDHPNASGPHLQTGRYWDIEANAGATGWNVDLTMPVRFVPATDGSDKLCRYTAAGGDPHPFECGTLAENDGNTVNNTITRQNVSAFSTWTGGSDVLPTVVSVREVSAGNGAPTWIWMSTASFLTVLSGMIIWARRRNGGE